VKEICINSIKYDYCIKRQNSTKGITLRVSETVLYILTGKRRAIIYLRQWT